MKKKGLNKIVLVGLLICILAGLILGTKYYLEEKKFERVRISQEEMFHYLKVFYDTEKECRDVYEKNLGNQILWSDVGYILKQLGLTNKIDTTKMDLTSNEKILKEEWEPIFLEIVDYLKADANIRKMKIIVLKKEENKERCSLITDSGTYTFWDPEYFEEYGVYEVLVNGNEILGAVDDVTTEEKLNNVWVTLEQKGISIKLGDTSVKLDDIKVENKEIEGICDIYFQDMNVKKLVEKKDVIKGKLLSFDEKQIEVEGYGTIPCEENFRLYQTYDKVIEKEKKEMVVGDNWIQFVVADKKICAGLITQPLNMETIRVLVLNNEGAIEHDKVEITSSDSFYVISGNQNIKYEGGEIFTADMNSKMLESGYIRIESGVDDGKISVKSISRSLGVPAYEGTLEIRKKDNGLILVNEIAMENYLYAVLPSEMPSSFGNEALKVQAICARTFAYCQILKNEYAAYGAHVDDSTNYQVYNNLATNKEAIDAVDKTKGLVATYKDDVIETYYFSCSSGHTTDFTAWGEEDGTRNYLKGVYVGENCNSEDSKLETDLSSEKNFKKFIENDDVNWYDQSGKWFRWNCIMLNEDITKKINDKILERYDVNNELISASDKNGEVSINNISKCDEIKAIKVNERDENGNVLELIIEENSLNIKIKSEYNIRLILATAIDKAINKDEEEVEINGLLPSAFFYIEPQNDKNKNVTGWKFVGGGHGHGIGLSQTACKTMDKAGMKYEEILNYFYNDIELKNMYKEE